jgi:hypothetical protein
MQTLVRSMEKKTVEEEGGGNENETPTTRDICDHQAAVYNRCEDVLCAVPPAALRTRMRGRDGFVADVHSNSDGGGPGQRHRWQSWRSVAMTCFRRWGGWGAGMRSRRWRC